MKTTAENLIHLQKIYKKLNRINNYTEELNYEEFVTMQSRREAILKQLHKISEEAFLLTDYFMAHNRKVDFRALRSFRNIHYRYPMQSDSHLLWLRIKKELPKITRKIQEVIYKLEVDEMLVRKAA